MPSAFSTVWASTQGSYLLHSPLISFHTRLQGPGYLIWVSLEPDETAWSCIFPSTCFCILSLYFISSMSTCIFNHKLNCFCKRYSKTINTNFPSNYSQYLFPKWTITWAIIIDFYSLFITYKQIKIANCKVPIVIPLICLISWSSNDTSSSTSQLKSTLDCLILFFNDKQRWDLIIRSKSYKEAIISRKSLTVISTRPSRFGGDVNFFFGLIFSCW